MPTHDVIPLGPSGLGYRKFGAGPDIVFVHGWPLHGETFRHIVPRLSSRFTCHVFDLPGAGHSRWDDSTSFTFHAHAARVLAAIDILKLARVAFVAHDSGGAIARLAAARLGTRCVGLVLGNTEIPAYRPPLLSLYVRVVRVPGVASLLPLLLRSRALRHSGVGLGGAFEDKDLIDGEFGQLFLMPLRNKRAAAGQLALIRQFDWSVLDTMAGTHHEITAPVALIWGGDDPWFPVARARAMVNQFRGGAEFHELRPGKLYAHEEQPEIWARIAGTFLARVTQPRVV